MVSGPDERGQSVLIGSILLFGILIIAFAGYQAVAVPNQNSDVEFEHFQDIENQFSGLHSNIVNAIESDDERSVRLDLGLRYPPRLIALNPPPVDGQLRTTEAREVTITDGSGEITSEVCGADATSRSLIYSPGYNEFQNAQSITYENTFTTRTYQDGTIYGKQQLVRGNKIDLTLLNGSVSESQTGAYSLNINGTHRYRKSGEVTNPNVTLPTQFSANVWNNQILEGQSDVTASQNGSNHVDLSFTGDYRISCAVAGLGSDPAFTPQSGDTGSANQEYSIEWLSDLSGEEPDSTRDITVKVTDADGDPVERATVDFATIDSNIANFTSDNSTDETNQSGIATTNINFGSSGETEVYAAAGDVVTVEDVEVQEQPEFTTLNAETNAVGPGGSNNEINEVEFNWTASGNFEEVEFIVENTDDNQMDSTILTGGSAESGTITLDNFGQTNRNNIIITAEVRGSGSSEQCVIEEGQVDSGTQYTKSDFDC